jgi:uncharacterized FlgJ-related protein
MNGASFDVRKVAVNTLPTGLADDLLKSRDFVIVKQPRLESFETENRDALDEIATELEVLRHRNCVSQCRGCRGTEHHSRPCH